MRVSQIKGYDEYGYEVMDFTLPTMDEAIANAREFGRAIQNVGLNAYEAAEAIKRMSELLYRVEALECIVDDKIQDTAAMLESRITQTECDIAQLNQDLDDLRPATVEETENPKQKSDLEIFPQIEWDEDFLKFFDTDTRIDLALKEGNLFLN